MTAKGVEILFWEVAWGRGRETIFHCQPSSHFLFFFQEQQQTLPILQIAISEISSLSQSSLSTGGGSTRASSINSDSAITSATQGSTPRPSVEPVPRPLPAREQLLRCSIRQSHCRDSSNRSRVPILPTPEQSWGVRQIRQLFCGCNMCRRIDGDDIK